MQLFFGLRAAVADSKLKWPYTDSTRLRNISVESFWEGRRLGEITRICEDGGRIFAGGDKSTFHCHCNISFPGVSLLGTVDRLCKQRPAPQFWEECNLDNDCPGYSCICQLGIPNVEYRFSYLSTFRMLYLALRKTGCVGTSKSQAVADSLPSDFVLSKYNV